MQPEFPLSMDSINGPYSTITDAHKSISQNLIFLLKTIPGQWPWDPNLGVGLETYLFENYGSRKLDQLKSVLVAQTKRYLKCVEIIDVKFVSTPEQKDRGISNVYIAYHVPELAETKTIGAGVVAGGTLSVWENVQSVFT